MRYPATLLLTILLGAPSHAAPPTTSPATQPHPRLIAANQILIADNSPETRATLQTLSAIQDTFTSQNQTLRQATDQLRTSLKLNLVINWPDLKTQNILPTTPTSLTLRQVTPHQILRSLLTLAAPNPPSSPLDYLVSEGIIEVHTQHWLNRQITPRVYDLTPLINHPFYKEDTQETELAALNQIIPQLVTPTLWSQKPNLCKIFDHQLAVNAPLRSHNELSQLFDSLHHPIPLPLTQSQVQSNLRTGEPVNLPPSLRPTESYQHTLKQLHDPINSPFQFTGTPPQIAAALAAQTNLNLILDLPTPALPKEPIQFVASPPNPLQKILTDLFLSPHIPPAPPQDSRLTPQDSSSPTLSLSPEGVLTLTTRTNLSPDLRLAAYDLRDLIKRRLFESPNPKPTPHQLTAAILAGLAPFKIPDPQTLAPDNPLAESLRIPPIILEYQGLLLIRATPKSQRQISQHLATLAH